jgi:mannose-6-phosphate isomerase-like protein (cupin superfamily)
VVRKISEPVLIPVPGDKTIDEYVGRVSTGTVSVSVARMVAPPGWSEPFQSPDFDEVTIMLRGAMRIESANGVTDVHAGECVLVTAGERIRYSNPFGEDAAYWAVCGPAFSPETVHRERV